MTEENLSETTEKTRNRLLPFFGTPVGLAILVLVIVPFGIMGFALFLAGLNWLIFGL